MIHLQWETTPSPEGDAVSPVGDAVSPAGDLLASPNFGICDTTQICILLSVFLEISINNYFYRTSYNPTLMSLPQLNRFSEKE
jgi:hypothetical protein